MTPQDYGYITINNTKLKILRRISETEGSCSFKLRISGSDGTHFIDEQLYLEENPTKVMSLIDGQTINF
jgi:hypothetical protein